MKGIFTIILFECSLNDVSDTFKLSWYPYLLKVKWKAEDDQQVYWTWKTDKNAARKYKQYLIVQLTVHTVLDSIIGHHRSWCGARLLANLYRICRKVAAWHSNWLKRARGRLWSLLMESLHTYLTTPGSFRGHLEA